MSTSVPHLLQTGDGTHQPEHLPIEGQEPNDGGDPQQGRNYVGIVTAGVAKTVAAKSAGMVKGSMFLTKGTLKWWFRYPIKLFRPYKVNPWMVLQGAAAEQVAAANAAAQKSQLGVLKAVVKAEGWTIVPNHVLPLLVANALAGIVLFNSYDLAVHTLRKVNLASAQQAQTSILEPTILQDAPHPSEPIVTPGEITLHGSHLFPSHSYLSTNSPPIRPAAIPYLGGLFAGAIQSFATAPLENVHRWLDPETLVKERKTKSVVGHVKDVVMGRKSLMDVGKGWGWLWRGTSFVAVKDGLGFSMFFGTFELVKNARPVSLIMEAVANAADRLGSQVIPNFWPKVRALLYGDLTSEKPLPRAPDLVLAGATAGAAFQLVIHPLDRLRPFAFPDLASQPAYDPISESYIRTDAEALRHRQRRRFGRSANDHGWWIERATAAVKKNGVQYFFRSVWANMARTVPVSAVALVVFEWVSRESPWEQ
ncbi:mitochondrial carrier [Gonapodya prolifera JEL478]|uniref:Mitochondrial carrier n=1 Tax=Gonapodya prolifera (strain JEL478) TaxID=1344416 RepID=A0A139AIH8_GONPJ|nr:mitochondrial carrier [Gonapodya prolifera JEL478]|eukprot:KXS16354.1 mitochondrial carrier [Gonapodya prolifera JEL478]